MESQMVSWQSWMKYPWANTNIGLALKQAMLINGILYNSEAWQSISEEEYKQLEEVDNHLIRKIFQAHSKTSTSFLHLESGTLPVQFALASRRLIYYFNILSRADSELVQRVLKAQMLKPTKKDWFNTIKILQILMKKE